MTGTDPHSIVGVQLADFWGDERDVLGFDARFRAGLVDYSTSRALTPTFVDLRELESAISVTEVVVGTAGASTSSVRHVDRMLRRAGYRRHGRAWGEAGETRRYVRKSSLRGAVTALVAEGRIAAGLLVVHARDRWLDPGRREALARRLRVRLQPGLDPSDELDARAGRRLPLVPQINVHELLPPSGEPGSPLWRLSLDEAPTPFTVARACHDRLGVWPISFSFPGEPLPIRVDPSHLIASIVPGFPYSFTDVTEYLRTYQDAYLGVTHRKAGWDCFRHVEILSAGAIPLMPDAREIPEWSMVHYPKTALAEVARQVRKLGSPPDTPTREAFRSWFDAHLTSASMARYVLSAADLEGARRVLFVDERLPSHADYQSVLTLLGLKQHLGRNCDVMFSTDYIYEDTAADVAALYGRGFGYSRLIPGSSRSNVELGGNPDFSRYDAVIVGSIARNRDLALELLSHVPPERTIWIDGEDMPPTPEEVHMYKASGTHVFVRAIHRGR